MEFETAKYGDEKRKMVIKREKERKIATEV